MTTTPPTTYIERSTTRPPMCFPPGDDLATPGGPLEALEPSKRSAVLYGSVTGQAAQMIAVTFVAGFAIGWIASTAVHEVLFEPLFFDGLEDP
jgi:hypothetical protein